MWYLPLLVSPPVSVLLGILVLKSETLCYSVCSMGFSWYSPSPCGSQKWNLLSEVNNINLDSSSLSYPMRQGEFNCGIWGCYLKIISAETVVLDLLPFPSSTMIMGPFWNSQVAHDIKQWYSYQGLGFLHNPTSLFLILASLQQPMTPLPLTTVGLAILLFFVLQKSLPTGIRYTFRSPLLVETKMKNTGSGSPNISWNLLFFLIHQTQFSQTEP